MDLVKKIFNKDGAIGGIAIGLALGLLLTFTHLAGAWVRYGPAAQLNAGDITTTHIKDKTILDDDVATSTYFNWGGIQIASSTGSFFNVGTTTGSIYGGLSFGGGKATIYQSSDGVIDFTLNDVLKLSVKGGNIMIGDGTAGIPNLMIEVISNTNPVYTFVQDTDTGIGGGTNTLSLITGGVNGLQVTNEQNVGIGTTSPFTKLGVAGTITANQINATSTTATSTFTGGIEVGAGGIKFNDGTTQTTTAAGETASSSISNIAIISSTASTTLFTVSIPGGSLNTYGVVQGKVNFSGFNFSLAGSEMYLCANYGTGNACAIITNGTGGISDTINGVIETSIIANGTQAQEITLSMSGDDNTSFVAVSDQYIRLTTSNSATVDSTVAQTFSLVARMNTSGINDKITAENMRIEILKQR